MDTTTKPVRRSARPSTGLRSPSDDHGSPAAPGSILLVHGWQDSSFSFTPLVRASVSHG